jgi:HD-like signal output (HDOD) protein/ActR/RegA family two-component response regulator
MAGKLRILFVDDERHVLEGLRAALRRDRTRWELAFAEGAEMALEKVRQEPFDLLICDMRMPGMDGPALLERIKIDHPATVRVILSGEADRATLLRALPVAQQFLSKPCSAETLRRTIERAEQVARLIDDPAVRELIGRLYTLPTPAALRDRLVAALAAGSIAGVAAIAREDPALAAKLLQLANWECFGSGRVTSSIEQAVQTLGLELVAILVRAAGDQAQSGDDHASLSRLQRGAQVAARLAQLLVVDRERAAQAFAAGLLHDVAVLAMAGARAHRDPVEVPSDHGLALIGGYLLSVWGLPEPVVEAVIHHRAPSRTGRLEFEIVGAVHVAISLAKEFLARGGEAAVPVGLEVEYLNALGAADQLPDWRALVEAELRRLKETVPS